MFGLLLSHTLCLNPIILVPPMYGSKLFATYDKATLDSDLLWYCPNKMDDELFWVKPTLAVPPMLNCLFQLLEMHIDPVTNNIVSKNNVTVTTHDFGGDTSVDYVDSGIFGFHFIETFDTFLTYFKNCGYTIHKNLFAVPYDWRSAVIGLDNFWPEYQKLIERSLELNDGKKVTIFAYSTGGYLTQYFLAELVSQEWKEKYIASVVYLAPSFGGITISWDSLFRHYCPLLPFVHNEYLTRMINGFPILYTHFLNHVIFRGEKVIFGPDGTVYGPTDMPNLLLQHGKIFGDGPELLRRAVAMSEKAPRPVGLPTTIVYNSRHPTHFAMNFSRGWDEAPVANFTRGDGTIPARGPEWACENWGNWRDDRFYPADDQKEVKRSMVHCLDVNSPKKEFKHVPMASNRYIHQLAYNLTNHQDWLQFEDDKPEEEWNEIYQRTWD